MTRVLSHLLLTTLAAVLGGSGIFLIWASFYVPDVALSGAIALGLACLIVAFQPYS